MVQFETFLTVQRPRSPSCWACTLTPTPIHPLAHRMMPTPWPSPASWEPRMQLPWSSHPRPST